MDKQNQINNKQENLRGIRFLTGTDSYKLSHWAQYPEHTTRVYSNLTPRSSRIPGVDHAIFFGLQAFLHEWCQDAFNDFLKMPEEEAVKTYALRVMSIVGPSNDTFERIRALHRLGYLPLRFCAVKEGTPVPMRIPMMTVENTHPDFYWLTNYIESVLSAYLWHPITSATLAWHLRSMLNDWAMKTAGTIEPVAWQGHDFSLRGLEGLEAAGSSGAGHLLSFTGTDSLPALDFVDMHYDDADNGLIGGSVPATEHSVMCAGGVYNERDTYERLLKLYPEGIVSIVSDTWDLWKVCTEILPSLHQEIMSRNGKLVVRPDSGDPVNIICGDPEAPYDSPQYLGLARILAREFGATRNTQGYLELDSHIGMIYGDSITYERAEEMCRRLAENGFASTNIVLGVGSYTYQYVTRDTLGIAMKATWAEIDGVGHELFKDPITDNGIKKSACGRLAVVRDEEGKITLIEKATAVQESQSLLEPVFENGNMLRTQSFVEIRSELWKNNSHRQLSYTGV